MGGDGDVSHDGKLETWRFHRTNGDVQVGCPGNWDYT